MTSSAISSSRSAERQNFDFLEIRKDNERNTTLAFVELDKGGERRFSFYRKNTADYILQSAAAEKIAKIADIVHIGSVPSSKEEGPRFRRRTDLTRPRAW